MSFGEKLISWYTENGRALPWRDSNDPYIIWLSEIILQQTRVEQGMPYFYRFVKAFPTVQDFAHAAEDEILRLWQGLGYYSRARNMHKAARMVVAQFNGQFPKSYTDVIQLAGVGEYTAAAIASFSNNEARAVVDGNVYRVLARYFGIDVPINSTAGKKLFAQLADELLSKQFPAAYNQGIMDFGALQCKPKNPLCDTCIFRLDCNALREGNVALLPVKLKAKKSRDRYFHYFILQQDDEILMAQREATDIWANLYEFPMLETDKAMEINELQADPQVEELFDEPQFIQMGAMVKQVLSHQNVYATFYLIENPNCLKRKKSNWNYLLLENLDKLAKHKLIFSFLEKNTFN